MVKKPSTKNRGSAYSKPSTMSFGEIDPFTLPPGTEVWTYKRHSPGEKQTIESQDAAIKQVCMEHGWIITREFCDQGVSGSKADNREDFARMNYLALQEPRPAVMIVVWDLSRFSRNQTHSQLYRAQLRNAGWIILSLNDNIPPGPIGLLYEAMIDWMNEMHNLHLRANTIRGLRYIAQQGCLPGGSICKGYTFSTQEIGIYFDGTPRMGRKPEIDPETGKLVVKAFEMKAEGAPYAVIAKATGLYGEKDVGSWNHLFRNKAYIGKYEFQGEEFPNVYPRLVSDELFEAVQKQLPKFEPKKLTVTRHHPRRIGSNFFLANVSRCGYCDGRMEGKSTKSTNGRLRYYVCAQHNANVNLCPDASLIPADQVETEILSLLQEHILTTDYFEDLLEWTNQCLSAGLDEFQIQLDAVYKQFIEEERRAENMTDKFYELKRPTERAERKLHEQEAKVAELKSRLEMIEAEIAGRRIEIALEGIRAYTQRNAELIKGGEPFDLREVMDQLCSRIVMRPDGCRMEIHFPSLKYFR